jgi:hypothetical protein
MLSEEEMKRIAAEERYRHEVRKSLDAAPAPEPLPPAEPAPPAKHGFGKRMFEFFNSSVGMWLLSSVVLTGGAAMIQQIQHDHENAQKNRQDLFTHHFEIHSRLENMAFLLRRAKTVGEAKTALAGIYKSAVPLSPDLQNRSLGSLYLAVFTLLDGSEKDKTNRAFNIVKQLEEVELLLQQQPDDKPLDQSQRNHVTKLIAAVQQLHLGDPK